MMRMSRHCRSWPLMSAAINQTVALGRNRLCSPSHADDCRIAESEERFRSADHAAIGMALVAPSGEWVKVTEACVRSPVESEFRTASSIP